MTIKEREEILTAFERCTKGPCSRANCPRYDSDNTVGHKFCHRKIMLDTLALLKELNEENKRLYSLQEDENED